MDFVAIAADSMDTGTGFKPWDVAAGVLLVSRLEEPYPIWKRKSIDGLQDRYYKWQNPPGNDPNTDRGQGQSEREKSWESRSESTLNIIWSLQS